MALWNKLYYLACQISKSSLISLQAARKLNKV